MELRGLKEKSPWMVSSHQMQKFLKKEADGFVAQLCSLEISQFQQMLSSHKMQKFLKKGVDGFVAQLCSSRFTRNN